MNRKHKNYLIWLVMGVHTGSLLAELAKTDEPASTWKWILLGASLLVIMLHYLPEREEAEG